MPGIEYRQIHGQALVAGKGTTKTTLRLPPSFEARHVLLKRQGWEHVTVVGVTLAGEPIDARLRPAGDDKVVDLPLDGYEAPRELCIEWSNLGARPFHVSYTVTEEPKEGAPPATLRVAAPPEPPERPVPQGPPSELEEVIAQSFGLPFMRLREIVSKLAGNVGLETEPLYQFFGADGYAMIPQAWFAENEKRAAELHLPAAELLVAKVFHGIRESVQETQDVVGLVHDHKAGVLTDGPRPDDFVVSTEILQSEAPTSVEVPEPVTNARLYELARWFKVRPEWLKDCLKAVADLRGQNPDDLIRLLSLPVVNALRQMFISVVSAPDDAADVAVARSRSSAAPEQAARALNEGIATRSIDCLAAGTRQGRT